ncbi:hypothetical protein ACJIZ3_023759 [Penstemon smallii]|uniref:Uncharacterized protein n=1 Tax=Penstemon smallii TaxID=265156 RepID=A0ABD3TRW7_9LAMI
MDPRLETADYGGSEFDYQTDFTKFLEEARKNTNDVTLNTSNLQEPGKKYFNNGEKRNRKSWKNSLFSWLNTDKKSKSDKQPTNGSVVSKTRRGGHVSGPVQVSSGGGPGGKAHRTLSGPLTGLFSRGRRVKGYEAGAYMCLDKISSTQKLRCYGPVYLVT